MHHAHAMRAGLAALTGLVVAACGAAPTEPPLRPTAPRALAIGGGDVMFNPQPDPPRVLPTYPTRVSPTGASTAVSFDPQPDPPIVTGR